MSVLESLYCVPLDVLRAIELCSGLFVPALAVPALAALLGSKCFWFVAGHTSIFSEL